MTDREPTLESLRLGSALVSVMHGAGLNRAQISDRLGWDLSTTGRLINGIRGGQAWQVTAWLDQCDVAGELRAEILRMRLPCGTCGCRCDHTGLLACCDAAEAILMPQVRDGSAAHT